jgi:4-phytase / acid phosphatase
LIRDDRSLKRRVILPVWDSTVKIAVMGFLIVTIFLSANGTIANAQNSAATAPKLMFIVILTRHGVRSPTWTPPALNEYSAEPWPDWGVAPGKLTPRGRELMTLFGSYYRLYFAAAGLLPSTGCEDARHVRILADAESRTRETGDALAVGIMPGCGIR